MSRLKKLHKDLDASKSVAHIKELFSREWSHEEFDRRLKYLTDQYGMTDQQVVEKAEAGSLPSDPEFVEWLILLGRLDLLKSHFSFSGRLPSSDSGYEKVNHPAHYGGDTTYEVVKVLDAWGLDKDFYLATVIKYIARLGRKPGVDPIEDLRKAAWYLERRISRLQAEGGKIGSK